MTNSNVDTGQQDMVIEGYAIIFNSMSDDLGGFREIVAPNALNDVDVSDVKCLINHDFSYVIGRTQAGTLELQVDTSYARDIYENIKAGKVNQCSFFYTLPPNDSTARTWKNIDNEYVQTINKIDELIEVSIVTVPAYKDTSVEVGQRAKDLKKFKQLEQMKIALDLESLRFET